MILTQTERSYYPIMDINHCLKMNSTIDRCSNVDAFCWSLIPNSISVASHYPQHLTLLSNPAVGWMDPAKKVDSKKYRTSKQVHRNTPHQLNLWTNYHDQPGMFWWNVGSMVNQLMYRWPTRGACASQKPEASGLKPAPHVHVWNGGYKFHIHLVVLFFC